MLVQEFLERSAAILPHKVALICDSNRLTYAEIESYANCLANYLLAKGFQRGARAVLYMQNSPGLVISIFGVLKAGGVFVVVNPTTKEDKLAFILHNCEASALVIGSQFREMVNRLQAGMPGLQVIIGDYPGQNMPENGDASLMSIIHSSPSTCPRKVNIDLDLACLIYTSGSTGEPKGVMSDHSNVDFATTSIISYLENKAEDIVINVLPLSFDYGLYQLLMTFKFGGTLVLEKGFAFPAAILKRMETERVTGFPGVPTVFSLLLNMDLSKYDLSNLRYLSNTAAALPTSHIQEIRKAFPQAKLFSMYGLTETKRTLYLPPEELDRRPGSVGIAIPGTEVWLEDEQGNRLGPRQVGELVIRGRHVMRGYWRDERLTAERFRPGSLPGERVCYSGDLFEMDEEGFFYFVARKDDIIKSRGEKVSPREVENVLYQIPGVVLAAVIGIPDAVLGQAVKAFVVPATAELTEKEILRYCREHLEDYMLPKTVEIVSDLPKTASGKINKKELA